MQDGLLSSSDLPREVGQHPYAEPSAGSPISSFPAAPFGHTQNTQPCAVPSAWDWLPLACSKASSPAAGRLQRPVADASFPDYTAAVTPLLTKAAQTLVAPPSAKASPPFSFPDTPAFLRGLPALRLPPPTPDFEQGKSFWSVGGPRGVRHR